MKTITTLLVIAVSSLFTSKAQDWAKARVEKSPRHLEWIDLMDKTTRRFKSADEIGKLFNDAGIDLKAKTATHCQSGGRASVMAFGLELMGAKDVSNYYRSWSEWGNSDDTPVVPGKPKK